MPQENKFQYTGGLSDVVTRHFAISPDDDADLPILPRALKVTTSGDLVLVDGAGTEITYAVTAGDLLPIRAKRVKETGTTATVVGWD